MNDNKVQKIVGVGSITALLLMIAILFSNGTFGDRASAISAAGLDSEAIVQMDESAEMEEMGAEEMEDEDEGQDYGEDEDEMDDDDEDDEGGLLGFDFEFGWFGEKD